MGICQNEKISMGKKLNEIINGYVKDHSQNPDKFKKEICQHPMKKGFKCDVKICPEIITDKEYGARKVICKYLH